MLQDHYQEVVWPFSWFDVGGPFERLVERRIDMLGYREFPPGKSRLTFVGFEHSLLALVRLLSDALCRADQGGNDLRQVCISKALDLPLQRLELVRRRFDVKTVYLDG